MEKQIQQSDQNNFNNRHLSPIGKEFAYFTANLGHIFPGLDLQEQVILYKKLKNYSSRQAHLNLRGGLKPSSCPSQLRYLASGRPCMFVSFHFGSYRSLPLQILAQGRSVCVLLSKDVFDLYQKYYCRLLGSGQPKESCPRLYLLRAEDSTLFFKLRSMQKAGVPLFIYADGDRGALKDPSGKGLSKIQLGSAEMMVRSGYLEIAHLLNMEVHLLLDHSPDPLSQDQLDARIFCYKLKKYDSKKDFVQNGLKGIYEKFHASLRKAPALWEALLYLHRYNLPKSSINQWNTKERLLGFTSDSKSYALDRFTYRKYPLGDS
ncbi:hypothetical protein PZ892_16525 [Sphingobacterium sp. WM]|uniref:hypothetical protein n=1 Tax=Sphingobacterium sp. WM TaxID=3031802 RepID=UPI00240D887E|nr:hypothetical protein [Sphingobacterium sp. WM]WFB63265.1 hypothetical protein PZ892_16525 [Sphingobacterium sp. WM]